MMTTEEKAKHYDLAIETAKCIYNNMKEGGNFGGMEDLEEIFPELKESEDERIRKELIAEVKEQIDCIPAPDCRDKEDEKALKQLNKWLAWLENVDYANKEYWRGYREGKQEILDKYAEIEKQGEQDDNEDSNILQRFSFYSYKDEPNILYLSGLYVNEEYRNKGIGTKILEVTDEVAKSLNCHTIRLKTKKDSNAERLYRTHGYNSLTTEDSDEIWLEKQCEQKPLVIPKFREGDIIKRKDTGETFEVSKIEAIYADEIYYHLTNGGCVSENSDNFERVEQKSVTDLRTWKYIVDAVLTEKEGIGQYLDSPFTEEVAKKLQKRFGNIEQKSVWSEEDENLLELSVDNLTELKNRFGEEYGRTGDCIDWIESLKERCTWKPSELQIEALESATENCAYSEYQDCLRDLIKQLKQLS